MQTPRVFISYSWHPKENQIRVEQLSERLFSDGVHCVMDIYDLKDGQDKYKFMEQMVNDPTVSKVLLICNKEYAEKANARKGGVGIESTIVSEEIYNNAEQTKFIPVVFEYDAQGKAYVPTFVKSRIFVDLSTEEKYAEGYDQLLRDIYDKPLHKRPTLGNMPSYLKEDNPIFLPTTHKVDTIKQAILSGSSNVATLIQDYLDLFVSIVPNYKIAQEEFNPTNFIAKIDEGINQMLPLRDDFITFAKTIAKTSYCTGTLFVDFIEKYLQTLEDNDIKLPEEEYLDSMIYDHFRHFNYDWFLSLCYVLIDSERFDVLRDIVKSKYCIITRKWNGEVEGRSYLCFQTHNYTLNDYKNKQEKSNRVSINADYIYNHAKAIKNTDLVRTDLLLYYLSVLYPSNFGYKTFWYPDCSIYNRGVEVLPKLVSKRYFEKAKVLFGVTNVEEYVKLISSSKVASDYYDGMHMIPNIKNGLLIEKVATI